MHEPSDKGCAVRTLTVIAMATLCSVLVSCSALRMVATDDPKLTRDMTPPHRASVVGYTTTDAQYHPLAGSLVLAGDSLVFTHPPRRATQAMHASPGQVIVLAKEQVVSVKQAKASPRRIAIAVAFLGLLGYVVFFGLVGTWG